MRRRDFITVLAGATALMSPARAQGPRRVIGVLGSASYGAFPGAEPAFIRGLEATGFLEGKNISIEWRWASGQYNRLSSLAGELLSRNVAVIATFDAPSSFAAKAATKTTPIVFVSGADPVKIGLVESFSRPNGNLTGMTGYFSVAGAKRVELLHELLPNVKAIALLGNPNNVNFPPAVPDIRAAADALEQRLEVLTASTESELEAAFVTMVQRRVDGLVVMPDPLFVSRRKRVVELAAHHRMPTIYPLRVFADIGGLMSYGSSPQDLHERAGVYVGKILKGAKPADLPIQQSTKVELVINPKTARALGLTVPPELLARADDVIE
jgi:putative ABC transport system substrate-binding protein